MRILSKKMNGSKKEITWNQEARNKKLINQFEDFKNQIEEHLSYQTQ
jgi:hypothetical protein